MFITKDFLLNVGQTLLCALIGYVWARRKRLKLTFQSLIRYNKDVRISIAYLYRLKIDNKYILVKGNHIDQYQPIGGVYKTYESFNTLANKWEIHSDENENFYEKKDLRLKIKGQYLSDFIKWFETKKNREVSVYREFYEELVETEILNSSDMDKIRFEFIYSKNLGIQYSKYFSIDEFKLFNIYEVHLNKDIEEKLKIAIKNDDYLVSIKASEIKKECFEHNKKSTKIGAHTKYIL